MTHHEELYDGALEAAQELYADTDIPLDRTRESLKELRQEIDLMITSLDSA